MKGRADSELSRRENPSPKKGKPYPYEGALIAFGPDGVELALRLEAMKIAPPASFRVMLDQHASAAGDQSYSLGQLTMEAPK